VTMAMRLLTRGVRPGGSARWWQFARTLLAATPRQIPLVMSDWISGLSMRKYAERYLLAAREPEVRAVVRLAERLRNALAGTALDVDLEMANLSMTLHGVFDSPALSRASRHLQRLLRRTRSTIELRIDACDTRRLERLLRRLSRYGDRVSVSIGESVREVIDVDWSRFELVRVTASENRS